jgi:hypothetical protein
MHCSVSCTSLRTMCCSVGLCDPRRSNCQTEGRALLHKGGETRWHLPLNRLSPALCHNPKASYPENAPTHEKPQTITIQQTQYCRRRPESDQTDVPMGNPKSASESSGMFVNGRVQGDCLTHDRFCHAPLMNCAERLPYKEITQMRYRP